jgi:hypothetical protein
MEGKVGQGLGSETSVATRHVWSHCKRIKITLLSILTINIMPGIVQLVERAIAPRGEKETSDYYTQPRKSKSRRLIAAVDGTVATA